jgi:hypothetical protein
MDEGPFGEALRLFAAPEAEALAKLEQLYQKLWEEEEEALLATGKRATNGDREEEPSSVKRSRTAPSHTNTLRWTGEPGDVAPSTSRSAPSDTSASTSPRSDEAEGGCEPPACASC